MILILITHWTIVDSFLGFDKNCILRSHSHINTSMASLLAASYLTGTAHITGKSWQPSHVPHPLFYWVVSLLCRPLCGSFQNHFKARGSIILKQNWFVVNRIVLLYDFLIALISSWNMKCLYFLNLLRHDCQISMFVFFESVNSCTNIKFEDDHTRQSFRTIVHVPFFTDGAFFLCSEPWRSRRTRKTRTGTYAGITSSTKGKKGLFTRRDDVKLSKGKCQLPPVYQIGSRRNDHGSFGFKISVSEIISVFHLVRTNYFITEFVRTVVK